VGDRVLVDVAGVIGGALRDSDAGGAFRRRGICRPAARSRRARNWWRSASRRRCAGPGRIRGCQRRPISVGIACQATDEETLDSLLLRPDRALYRAKQQGRNRIEVAQVEIFQFRRDLHICQN
jgi:GGDEF domain-containing protein